MVRDREQVLFELELACHLRPAARNQLHLVAQGTAMDEGNNLRLARSCLIRGLHADNPIARLGHLTRIDRMSAFHPKCALAARLPTTRLRTLDV